MSQAWRPNIIGDRINPGFKSTLALLDTGDVAGMQALAVRQVETGATALDFTIGPRAREQPEVLAEWIRVVQAAVSVPLCFDYLDIPVLDVCLRTYDQDKALGRLPIINSLAETRWELMSLYELRPFRVMLMASERMEDGAGRPNRSSAEISATAKRAARRLVRDFGLALDDIIIDVSVSAVIVDTTGLNRAALDAIREIGTDPDLKGIHVSGGITNIGQQMPAKAGDGSDLKRQLECAFITLAAPLGLDTVLATPWHGLYALPEGNFVLETFRRILELKGSDALREVRKLYRKQA
ncbi:MAG: dihydropteroate synthase [Betaproteobacteria bacterium]|nr:dihydropteroate synthase [Betaproteobacteria bacterium]